MKTKLIIGIIILGLLIAIGFVLNLKRQPASDEAPPTKDVTSQPESKSALTAEEQQKAQAEAERIRKYIIEQGVTLNNAPDRTVIDPTMSIFIGDSGPESIRIMVDYLKKHEALLPTTAPDSNVLEDIKRSIRSRRTPESRLVLTAECLMESKSTEAHQEARDFITRFNEKYGDSEYGKFMSQELKQAREDGVGRRQENAIMVKYYKREIDGQQMKELMDKIDVTKED